MKNDEAKARLIGNPLRCDSGVSAAEFALILPVMILLLFGAMEFARAVENYRKVTQLARTIADLTAQGDTKNPISPTTMNDIFASSKLVLKPFDSSKAKVVVSAMGVNLATLDRKPYVCSSVASNTNARAVKAFAEDLTVPAPLQSAGARYIFAEVVMPYTPILGSSLVKIFKNDGHFVFSVSMAWPVRGGAAYNSTAPEIILPGGSSCPLL